eukprot:222012_1
MDERVQKIKDIIITRGIGMFLECLNSPRRHVLVDLIQTIKAKAAKPITLYESMEIELEDHDESVELEDAHENKKEGKKILKSKYNNFTIPTTSDEEGDEYNPLLDRSNRTKRKKKARNYNKKRKAKCATKQKGAKLVKCNICMKVLKSTSLKSHCRIHSGEKPWQCRFCSSKYRTWTAANCHTAKVHGYDKKHPDAKPIKAFV